MTIKTGTQILFAQIIQVLQDLGEDQYREPLTLFSGVSLGQHFRHVFEFYECLLKGCDEVDYASRLRNPLIETDVNAAALAFQDLFKQIVSLDESKSIGIVSDFCTEGSEQREVLRSSCGRELIYAYDHAIHHLAIIKMGLQVLCPKMKLPVDFGVAVSTIQFRQENRN